MRYFFFFCLVSSALAAHAQVSLSLNGPPEAEGSYVLQDNPQVRYTGRLKVTSKELVAKDSQGKKPPGSPTK